MAGSVVGEIYKHRGAYMMLPRTPVGGGGDVGRGAQDGMVVWELWIGAGSVWGGGCG